MVRRGGEVVATVGADGSALLDVLPAHGALSTLRARHEPDQRQDEEADEPEEEQDADRNTLADRFSRFAGPTVGFVGTVRVVGTGARDDPDQHQDRPDDERPGHLAETRSPPRLFLDLVASGRFALVVHAILLSRKRRLDCSAENLKAK